MKSAGFLKRTLAAAVITAGIALPAVFAPVALADYEDDPFNGADVVPQDVYRDPVLASPSNKPVAVQLVLAMDISGSMDPEEYEIELGATAYAINSELFRHIIKTKAGDKSVAISLLDFENYAIMRVPWVDIRSEQINNKPYNPSDPANSSAAPDNLDRLANRITSLSRRGSGGTSIVAALEKSKTLLRACPWPAKEKKVIDLFGDGDDTGLLFSYSREELMEMGVTINGFAIVNENSSLDDFFRENLVSNDLVKGPDGIYSQPGRVWALARNMEIKKTNKQGLQAFFDDAVRGMTQKISVEVAGIDAYKRAVAELKIKILEPVPQAVNR